jgi:hypothetical protein
MLAKLLVWLKQPTSVVGLSGIFGTVAAVLSGSMTWQAAVPLFAGAITAIILPDNSAEKTDVQAVAAAVVKAAEDGVHRG